MFVIKRTDQGGGYVARDGSAGSYTGFLQNARTFATKEQADRNHCPENEIVVPLEDELQKPS